jgi:glycosyltransferase involved in cell wall biosynthesis
MSPLAAPDVLIVNFNAPELNQLAAALARSGQLARFVRPYVNKGRLWERLLSNLPLAGRLYASTFGRRRLEDPALLPLTHEGGVAADLASAAVGRAAFLPDATRHRWTNQLRMHVRAAVAYEGQRYAAQAGFVVAYEGFALPAFEAARRAGTGGVLLLNYPVAHHRARRRIRDEENLREPAFAATWPGFDDWNPGHEARLDREIELADVVLLGSSFAADSFVAEGVPRSKLAVVPYGVDLQLFTPATAGTRPLPARPFQVIYAGQLTQRKGIAYLLRAYAVFRKADSTLTLVGDVVGSREPLKPFAKHFVHVPHQTRPALAERYRQAHVFVLPTLVEGMPLVVLEAMACGLPVIVTANGPAGIVRDGVDGYIVPERDPQAIAACLERLYADSALREQMGRHAAERAREFSWAAYAQGVQRCLTRVPAN